MTPQRAEDLLQTYARPTARHGGLCLIGIRITITQLDYNFLVKISGSIVNFDGYFARLAGAAVQGNVAAGTGRVDVAYQASRQTASIDMRRLTEIRVLDSNANNLALCPSFKPGYLVALKGERALPDQAQISINATSPTELNSILAMLTYFSPNARVVSGVGM
jgi:hypothetical protein